MFHFGFLLTQYTYCSKQKCHLSKFDIHLSAVQLSYHCKISTRKNSKVEFIIVIFKDEYDAFSSFMFPTFITLPPWDPLQTVQVCSFS